MQYLLLRVPRRLLVGSVQHQVAVVLHDELDTLPPATLLVVARRPRDASAAASFGAGAILSSVGRSRFFAVPRVFFPEDLDRVRLLVGFLVRRVDRRVGLTLFTTLFCSQNTSS